MKKFDLIRLVFFLSLIINSSGNAQESELKMTSIGLWANKIPSSQYADVRNVQDVPINIFKIQPEYLRGESIESVLTKYVSLSPQNMDGMLELVKNETPISLWIPIENGYGIQVDLNAHRIISDQFIVASDVGDTLRNTRSIFPHYTGHIHNDPESIVSMNVSSDDVRMMISNSQGNFNLVKVEGLANKYIFFNDQHVKNHIPFSCGIVDELGGYTGPVSGAGLSATTRARNRVEVYIEVDFDAYQGNGSSIAATRDWVLNIFRDMAAVYERHAISIRLNEIFIWTTNNDPFNGIGANFGKLDTALKNWSGIRTNFNGDVAHYMGTETGPNSVIGLANSIGEFCDKSGGFGDADGSSHSSTMGNTIPYFQLNAGATGTFAFDVPSWTMLGNLHELGHIFGANHTHACKWGPNGTTQIDDCGNVSAITNGVDDDGNGQIDDINDAEGGSCFFAETPIIPSNGGTIMSYCNFTFAGSPQINLSHGFHPEVSSRMRSVINSSTCINSYESICPEVETIELDFSGLWSAENEVLIHDSQVLSGNSAIVTAGDQVILYGDFTCPLNASFQISGSGCSN